MSFERGDRIEILNEEEGFEGSYFPANIISRISTNEYIAQYRTIVDDDKSGPLREILSLDKIRPKPREILTTEFRVSEMVDASFKDGWWTGKVIKKMGPKYLVRFERTNENIAFPFHLLRVHQDWNWKDGVWVYSTK